MRSLCLWPLDDKRGCIRYRWPVYDCSRHENADSRRRAGISFPSFLHCLCWTICRGTSILKAALEQVDMEIGDVVVGSPWQQHQFSTLPCGTVCSIAVKDLDLIDDLGRHPVIALVGCYSSASIVVSLRSAFLGMLLLCGN